MASRRPEGEPAARRAIIALDAPAIARDIRDATLIKEGDLFLLSDVEGNIPRGNRDGFGLYLRDTRFLSGCELSIQGLRPTLLLSSARSHFLGAQVLTNPNLATRDGEIVHEQTIQIRRYRIVRPAEVSESLTFQSYNRFPLALDVALHFEADFADMFEVRGIVKRRAGGTHHPVECTHGALAFRYDGADGVRRETRVRFEPPPTSIEGGTARYVLDLDAGVSLRIAITMTVDERVGGEEVALRAVTPAFAGYKRWLAEQVSIDTSNSLFNAVILQARYDLRVLLSGDAGVPYIAAGIPWYATLFGRDSLITALMTLWMSPGAARSTLRRLGELQGTRDDPARDEEPGKIMHELRRGEVATLGLVPFTPYFGTVDATPLWVMLLAEYYRTTGDLALLRELLPQLGAALTWIDRRALANCDGFVTYERRSALGLLNQGWKDSVDSIVDRDGSLPQPPIALVEAQAYAYAARRGAARLYRAVGDLDTAARQDLDAARLRAAFDAAFWIPSEGFYALALDGGRRQIKTTASNQGHALFSGIVAQERVAQVTRRLLEEDLYSGFGVRTLSTREAGYNPTGYHLGSVWPHDNALIALGLKRCQQEDLALELITGMFEAATHFPGYRMPELFCGFARSAFGVPVRYPLACSPQAWAAASWGAFLQVLLGIRPNAPAGELQISRPRLPPWLQWIDVGRIAVGSGEIDLRYERVGDHTAVDVAAMRGNVRVTFVERWDPDEG